MGDRTFSAQDVIRIYQDFLTSDEQETVDEFFMGMQEEIVPMRDNFFEELTLINGRVAQARVVLPGLFGVVLRLFSPLAEILVTTVMFQLERADILIRNLLAQEEVDA